VRRVIVNADDLGYDPEIDRGILQAHARGLVTSATAMVETPFAGAALRAAPASLGVGLHAVLGRERGEAAARAIRRQLRRFAALRGAPPTHLDSHKHLHARPDLLPVFADVARAEGLPLRSIDARSRAALRAAGVPTPDHFLGDAALRPCWTLERLIGSLGAIPDGLTEIMTHPGYRPGHVRTSFGVEREEELAALTSERALALVHREGLELVGYGALSRAPRGP
jgi:predicted glycoside hydrolase/deacetylase ChbG (UPF0249 family)